MSSMALEALSTLVTWLSLFCMIVVVFGCLYAVAAAWAVRWFVRRPTAAAPTEWLDVSILKPLFGIEAQLSENIESYLNQDYEGRVQIVFGVQDPDDAAIPVVESLMQRYPGLDLQLVVDGAMHGGNRKVSNLINMAEVARHPLIIMADSDIAVAPNYLRMLAAELAQPGVGAVTCLYRGAPNGGFWSRLCAMQVDDHFLPGVILGLALRLARPCVGATIALSRETLSRIGGFEAVANQLADDYAIGNGVRKLGLQVAVPAMLVSHSFEERSLREMMLHELRWARTIFTVDPIGYVGSGVTHVLPWSLIGAALRGFDAWGLAAILTALACRLLLKFCLARDFELPNANYSLTLIRDVLSFAVFFACFWSPRASWRGMDFFVRRDGTMAAVAPED
jgi:ceramide glucosyltransferase